MKSKREDLEDCIDPENGLLYKLKNQKIIDMLRKLLPSWKYKTLSKFE